MWNWINTPCKLKKKEREGHPVILFLDFIKQILVASSETGHQIDALPEKSIEKIRVSNLSVHLNLNNPEEFVS